eukprot:scaffold5783_cov129-Amphora_coffeaeformis.AAC.5
MCPDNGASKFYSYLSFVLLLLAFRSIDLEEERGGKCRSQPIPTNQARNKPRRERSKAEEGIQVPHSYQYHTQSRCYHTIPVHIRRQTGRQAGRQAGSPDRHH